MNELTNIKNDEAVTSSLRVAEVFGKQHTKVIRAIETIIRGLPQSGDTPKMFHKSWYVHPQNKQRYPMYYMNRDGFSLLVMGFTGKKALKWKLDFIAAFNFMEKKINFRKADIQIQKNQMLFLHNNLEMPTAKDYMKANTIANKCVSNMNGYPKMIKKADMSLEMLQQREPVLADVVELMAVKDKYDVDISIAESIYKRYSKEG